MHIVSNFPREIVATDIALSFEMQTKQTIAPDAISDPSNSSMLPMYIHLDYKQDHTLDSASVVCDTKGKQPVRRSSSTKRKLSPTGKNNLIFLTQIWLYLVLFLVRTDFTNNVSTTNVVLKPGQNIIEFKSKATRVGVWSFKQV